MNFWEDLKKIKIQNSKPTGFWFRTDKYLSLVARRKTSIIAILFRKTCNKTSNTSPHITKILQSSFWNPSGFPQPRKRQSTEDPGTTLRSNQTARSRAAYIRKTKYDKNPDHVQRRRSWFRGTSSCRGMFDLIVYHLVMRCGVCLNRRSYGSASRFDSIRFVCRKSN